MRGPALPPAGRVAPYCAAERVFLRPVSAADAPLIAAWKGDPVVRGMALGSAPATMRAPRLIQRALDSPGKTYLVIVLREGLRPIGYVCLNWLDGGRRFAWLRFAGGCSPGLVSTVSAPAARARVLERDFTTATDAPRRHTARRGPGEEASQ